MAKKINKKWNYLYWNTLNLFQKVLNFIATTYVIAISEYGYAFRLAFCHSPDKTAMPK